MFPRCGLKTAAKHYEDRATFERKLEEVEGARARYERNALLIDFANIPEELGCDVRAQLESVAP